MTENTALFSSGKKQISKRQHARNFHAVAVVRNNNKKTYYQPFKAVVSVSRN
jgi:hypothetical protein